MRKRGMSPFPAGLIAIVLVVAGSYLGFTKKIPFRSHFEIKAAFRSSNNLRPNSPVRIAGVEVGKVAKVEPTGRADADRAVGIYADDLGEHHDHRAHAGNLHPFGGWGVRLGRHGARLHFP